MCNAYYVTRHCHFLIAVSLLAGQLLWVTAGHAFVASGLVKVPDGVSPTVDAVDISEVLLYIFILLLVVMRRSRGSLVAAMLFQGSLLLTFLLTFLLTWRVAGWGYVEWQPFAVNAIFQGSALFALYRAQSGEKRPRGT